MAGFPAEPGGDRAGQAGDEVVLVPARGALSLPEKQHGQKRLLLLLSARLKPGDGLSRIGDGYLCFVDREVSRWLVVSQDTIFIQIDGEPSKIRDSAEANCRRDRHMLSFVPRS